MKYLWPGTGFCTLMLYCLTEKFVYCPFTIRLKQITKASQSFVHLFTRSLNPFYALDKPFKRNLYLFNVLEKMFKQLAYVSAWRAWLHSAVLITIVPSYRATWFKISHSSRSIQWQNILLLFHLLFTVPVSNAGLERFFNNLCYVKSVNRALLSPENSWRYILRI